MIALAYCADTSLIHWYIIDLTTPANSYYFCRYCMGNTAELFQHKGMWTAIGDPINRPAGYKVSSERKRNWEQIVKHAASTQHQTITKLLREGQKEPLTAAFKKGQKRYLQVQTEGYCQYPAHCICWNKAKYPEWLKEGHQSAADQPKGPRKEEDLEDGLQWFFESSLYWWHLPAHFLCLRY